MSDKLLIAFLLLAFAAVPRAWSQTQPGFTGSWTRVSQSCNPPERAKGSYRLAIRQHGSSIDITTKARAKESGEHELALSYRIGAELHYTGLDGDEFRSIPRWNGPDLAFNTVEMERGTRILTREVWSLVEGQTKLIQTKREDGEKEHSFCTSIFSRDKSLVQISLKKDRVVIEIDGKLFTNLYMGLEANKPYLYPLMTASGKRVSRGYPVDPLPGDPTDHPHQKGLWVGSEHLSGMDFWENDPSYTRPNMGRVVFKDVSEVEQQADQGSFTMMADWVSLAGETVISETRKMTFYARPENSRMIDVDLMLRAKRPVTFEDHHDSVIGIRLGPAFDERNGGLPINAQGMEGESQVRGRRSEWIDWRGDVGEKVGVCLMDHPGNYSFPTRWHVRSLGLLVASPFAQHDYFPEQPNNQKTLNTGEVLHLRYRLLIHPLTALVADSYREFAAQ